MVSYKEYTKPVPIKKKETPIETPKTTPSPNGVNTNPDYNNYSRTSKGIKVLRDTDTGKMTGVITPDGRTLQGLSTREVDFLARKYAGQTTAPAGTTFADEVATNERMMEKSKAEEQSLMQDIPSVPENTIDITKDNINYPSYDPITKTWSDTTTASILKNAKDQANMNKIPVFNILAKITGALPNEIAGTNVGTTKKLILSLGKENSEFRRYINDYSNSENIGELDEQIVTSNAEIQSAIDLSKDVRYASESKALYETALSRKRRVYNSYKTLSKVSPNEYLKVKNQMTELETYFNSQKLNDDITINGNIYNARMSTMVR
jgi:hypothetical protein